MGTLSEQTSAQSGANALVGYQEYWPGSTGNVDTSLTALTDVDASNLIVTFIAPASGKVLVKMSARGSMPAGAGTSCYWGLRNGAADVAGSEVFAAGSSAQVGRLTYSCRLTGLTPGASYSLKWAHRVSAGTATSRIVRGGSDGPAIMEVYAVPLGL